MVIKGRAPGRSAVTVTIWNALSPYLKDFVDAEGSVQTPDSVTLTFKSTILSTMVDNQSIPLLKIGFSN